MRRLRVLAIVAATLIAACGGGTPSTSQSPSAAATTEADQDITGPVTVTLWHALTSDPQKSALEAAVKKFNETNGKGITVNAVVQGNYTQLYQKTLAAIQAGSLPDMAHAYESFVADYTKADVVINLDPYVNSKKNGLDQASKDDIYKPYFDTNRFAQYNNQLLSFPFTKSLALMYSNDDALKAAGVATAPKTWDEWEQAVMKATKKDASGKTTQYGYAGTTDASYFNAMVLSRGGKLMSDDGKTVKWDGPEGLATLQMLKRLYDGGYAYTPTGFDWQNDFAQGKLAYTFASTSSRPFIAAAMKTPVNWSVSLPPGGKTVMFGANIAVFKTTPQKQLACWLFIKWFSEQAQTADWATKSFYMPVRKSAANNEALKSFWSSKDPQGKQAYEAIGSSIPEPNVRGQQDIRDVIFNMIQSVTTGKASAQQAIKDAETKANQILKDAQ